MELLEKELETVQKDDVKLEYLLSRTDPIEVKSQRIELLEKKVETKQGTQMNLEQKLLTLQKQLQNNKHKCQETIDWVDELENKLRQEQQQQIAFARQLTQLKQKLKALEKRWNQSCNKIAENTRQRCHNKEERVQDLVKKHKSVASAGISSKILQDRTMEESLRQAAATGDTYTVLLLISHGANVYRREEKVHTLEAPTPLHAAVTAGRKSTVFALLRASADANANAYTLATPLICATRGGNVDISQLLIKFGADVNFRDSENMTPLHYACSQGSMTLARLLIRNGASLSAKANNKTPADTAESNGHKHLAKYIRSKMT